MPRGPTASTLVDRYNKIIVVAHLENDHRIEIDNSKWFGRINVDGETVVKRFDLSGSPEIEITEKDNITDRGIGAFRLPLIYRQRRVSS